MELRQPPPPPPGCHQTTERGSVSGEAPRSRSSVVTGPAPESTAARPCTPASVAGRGRWSGPQDRGGSQPTGGAPESSSPSPHADTEVERERTMVARSTLLFVQLLLVCCCTAATASNVTSYRADVTPSQHTYNVTGAGGVANRRQKRLIAYNYDEQRITFPPGTVFFITPTLNVPFIRNLNKGFESKLTISAPFQMIFDDFGITDEYNPWGIVPGLSIPQDTKKRRRQRRYRRTIDDYNPHPLGDRVMLFQVIEQYLTNLGHNGPACLMRAICEINQKRLPYHGLFGEFLQMIFRVSTSPYAEELLPDYIKAELSGRESGVCDHYHAACPSSLLSSVTENRRRRPSNLNEITEKMKKNFVEN